MIYSRLLVGGVCPSGSNLLRMRALAFVVARHVLTVTKRHPLETCWELSTAHFESDAIANCYNEGKYAVPLALPAGARYWRLGRSQLEP